MSYKIKILSEDQYSALIGAKGNPAARHSSRLYLTTVLPGLFYCVTDKLLNFKEENFLYIPAGLFGGEYSPEIFDAIVYKKFELSAHSLTIDGKYFRPITVENLVVGGLMSADDRVEEGEIRDILQEFTVSDYFNLIFNINDQLAGSGEIARQLLGLMAEARSPDLFLRALPDWLAEFLGGGMVALYYRSGKGFALRKMAGQISHYEELPSYVTETEAEIFNQAMDDERSFIPIGSVPAYPMEMKVPPSVRFLMGGRIGNDPEYLLTGVVPNITSYSLALFFNRLRRMVAAVHTRHFQTQPDWGRIFATMDEMAAGDMSRQRMTEFLYQAINDFIHINRVSLVKYNPLENHLVIEGAVTASKNSSLMSNVIIPLEGTTFEKVVQSGKPYSQGNLGSAISNRTEYAVYKEGVRSIIHIPIMGEKNILGILNIGSPITGDYLHSHLPMLETFARYLARIFRAREQDHTIEIYSEQTQKWHDRLNALENLRTMGELASGVFHDLNNVMGAILGRCQIVTLKTAAEAGNELIDKIRKDISLIERSALDSGEILQRLRQLYRPKKDKQKTVSDLQEIINDAIEMVRPRWERLNHERAEKIVLKKEMGEAATILADQSEIREVFTNLLLNALDAMPQGGEITVSCHLSGQTAEVKVTDTGEGIEPDVARRIFEPFYTTKGEKGTGLGLSISRDIIRAHGGDIKVSSTPHKGTTFTIELPLLSDQDNRMMSDKEKGRETGGLRLLIVEDKPDLKDVLKEMLTSYGFETRTAGSGEEAIMLSGKEKFDVLISDLGLPGISGLDLITKIRSFDPRIRTILISGWEVEYSITDLMDKGVDSLITKPFKVETVLETMENLMGLKDEKID
ncbi:putative Histidine kinase [Candidatus Zixiibacteriota bacterium]|nr:putative Histidine kinase [candidate division Zixibacteria bacterium]